MIFSFTLKTKPRRYERILWTQFAQSYKYLCSDNSMHYDHFISHQQQVTNSPTPISDSVVFLSRSPTSIISFLSGTSVQVTRLFSNFPVRRNQFRGLRRLQDTLVAIEKLALSFALAHPKVQLGLTHGMERVFSKPCCEDRTEAVRLVLGRQRAASLVQLLMSRDEFEVELFLPRPDASEDKRLFAATPRLSFVFVNNRPVEMGEFHKVRCLPPVFVDRTKPECDEKKLKKMWDNLSIATVLCTIQLHRVRRIERAESKFHHYGFPVLEKIWSAEIF